MKPGARVLGVAESYTGERSTLAGAVMTVDGRIDDFCFETCTVGGIDATDAVIRLVSGLEREDIRVVLVAGVALAWYNIVDLDRLAASVDTPVVAVTFEESDGLEPAIQSAFDGDEREDRLARYRALSKRHKMAIGQDRLFVRTVDMPTSEATAVVEALTPDNATRPEPLRVANLAACAADELTA